MCKKYYLSLKKPLASLLLFSAACPAFASANFNIIPTPGSIIPSTVPPGETVSAFYTITNQSNRQLNGYSLQGLPSTVVVSTAGTCSNPVSLSSYASCQLQLDISGTAVGNFALCKSYNCTSAGTPLNVQAEYTRIVSYIGDNTTNLWQCPLTASGSFSFSSCTALSNSPSFTNALAATFYTFSGITYAYVSDNSSTLWKCPLNQNGGFSNSCAALTNSPSFSNTTEVSFASFSGTTYAYVADSSHTLWQCPMTTNGNFSGACLALNNSPSFNITASVSFSTFSGTNFAYITDLSSQVWKCPLNANGGLSGSCSALSNTPAFFLSSLIVFQSFSGISYAYITDLSNKLWQCAMNSNGNFSGNCTALTNSTPFINTNGISFHRFSGTSYAYLGDSSTKLWQCPMNANGGFSASCVGMAGFDQSIKATFYSF